MSGNASGAEEEFADAEIIATESDQTRPKDPTARVRDVIVLVLLSVTAVVTAWCGFQSSKWGGAMSISFSQASSARIAAARDQGEANSARQIDVSLWTLFVQATATGDKQLASYVQARFPDRLEIAYKAWQAQGQKADSPFALAAYQPPGQAASVAADRDADRKFATALEYNTRGDHYTVLTVLFAIVLFFAAVSPRLARPLTQWLMLAFALALFLAGVIIAATLPILIS
ncbi:hypothetical protein FOE78_13095 [Microlunatus elymi]|uniref:DUF4337 domain-containing protein n=1 Tax=Microlunatus elymi TaxID=2596828 RepID=A0A516PZW1_9ACTN|nr:hypothetical protein [Microlunatus elymi]QDP96719.1 hypothetical protein FOE78_13095 [Microlunatus elymi]